MALLGAILAGGASRRFGGDKALALWRGQPLIAHVVSALRAQCEAVVICGRAWGDLPALPDPEALCGPVAGLAAALAHARQHGFSAVLLAPCDIPLLPPDLARGLSPGPAVARGAWALGLWPVSAADALDALLEQDQSPSMRRVIAATRADVRDCGDFPNINSPADLEHFAAQQVSSN